jgi:hypothetical protein
VAGMIAGADSIDDMDLLRHGAVGELFGGIRAPSTLGSHLRSYTWGNVLQLEAVNRQLLAELVRHAPLLPGRDVLAFVDIDSMQTGLRAQEAGCGVRPYQDRGQEPAGAGAERAGRHDRHADRGAGDRRHPGCAFGTAAAINHLVGRCPSWHEQVRLIDATPCRAAPPGNRFAARTGGVGKLRLLRGALALVLGAEAVPDHHPGRDAGGPMPGRPQRSENVRWPPGLLAHTSRTGALRTGLILCRSNTRLRG